MKSDAGEFVRGRCKATNLCGYCAGRYALETAVMWGLDAMEDAPVHWLVLTAREHLTRSDCRDHLRQLRRMARRIWPAARWAVSVEFQRRGALHLNLLVKGVPVDEGEEFLAAAADLWCSRVDALPIAQHLQPVWDGKGLTRYLTEHVVKASQRPAKGWRGHRTSQTLDYLVRPASEMREEAQRALRLRWALHRGVPADLLELELELQAAKRWELVEVGVTPGGVLVPRRVIA